MTHGNIDCQNVFPLLRQIMNTIVFLDLKDDLEHSPDAWKLHVFSALSMTLHIKNWISFVNCVTRVIIITANLAFRTRILQTLQGDYFGHLALFQVQQIISS